ncbi:restriction endonuclease subunit S [uncultured Corynebacterium sp.]|uniref:restriction endonuclease subunit S n=1 Tax=uncultured Corynebacterium sp. TaxID=159447 RepID=UPI002889B3F4|nr:restriction endonuclease subunit S [uncultured Corynebacterium sp.]
MQTIKLGRILTDVAMGPFGSNLKAENFQPTGVPVIRGQNLNEFYVSNEKLAYVSPKKAAGLSRSLASPGEIVVTHRGTLGQVSMIPFFPKHPTYLVSQSQMRLAVDREQADPRFVTYWMRSRVGQHLLLSFAVQTGVPAIARPTSSLRDYPIALPELGKQRAIADLLGSLDDKIAANQRAASLSRQMVESIAETTNNYVSLGELAVRNKRTINPAKLGSNLVMHYSIPRFDSGSPALEPADSIKSNKNHVERASVLVSKLNPETPRVWSIPAPSKEPFSLASTEFIVLEPSGINQSQLYAATLHSNFHHQLASLVGGTSKSHQRVKPEEMLGCVVPDVRTLTDGQIELLETLVQIETQAIQEAETLAKTRDELLPLLMNGKITVREAGQEAAAAGAQIPSKENEV